MNRVDSIRRILLLAVVISLAFLVLLVRWNLHFTNYPGLILSTDMKVIRVLPDGPAVGTGIQVGDQITSFNNLPIQNLAQYFSAIQNPEITGRKLPVGVQREGKLLWVVMTLKSYPLFHPSFFGPGLGVALLVFGLYVFFKKPDDPGSELYLVVNSCLFVGLALSNHLLKQYYSPFIVFFWGVCLMMLVPLNSHFYLVFPEPKTIIRKKSWILATMYFPALIFVVLLASQAWDIDRAIKGSVDCTAELLVVRNIFVIYFFVGFFSFIGCVLSIVHSYLNAGSAERRKQVQVVMIGGMITLLLAIPSVGSLAFSLVKPEKAALWPSWAFSMRYGLIVLTTVGLPFSMAVAIMKYRLWDLDTAINRSLIYMGVSTVLLAMYFIIVGTVGWLFGRVVGPTSYLTVLVFTLIVALVAVPLRQVVRRLVERTFDREAHEYRNTLRAFSRELNSLRRLKDLTQGLCETVAQALRVNGLAVVLAENKDSGTQYRVAASHGFVEKGEKGAIDEANSIVELIRSSEQSLVLPKTPDAAAGFGNMTYQDDPDSQRQPGLIVPIKKEKELLGWIALGQKESRAMYTSLDRELLETLANQAAVAISNALAFEEIGLLNRDLRVKMQKIEEQRSEILQLQERLLDENRYLKEQIRGHYDFAEIVGAEHGLKSVMETVERAAGSDATILVCGESGTGKELVARAIHFNSNLKDGPFIKVNCAALAQGVLESELFGHEKGAFTGAHERRVGRFELADTGTIFLDEIGDIPNSTQTLLLRVLQEQEFERVGGSRTIKVRARVITATNRDLEAAVAAGQFRTDLFYRLKVISIEIPPLRERQKDIRELALHFVGKYARKHGKRILRLEEEVIERFKLYSWPGNVRELENVVERSVVLSRGESIGLEDIPMELKLIIPPDEDDKIYPASESHPGSYVEAINEVERQRLVAALEEAKGNKSQAARLLGLKRSTFFNKLKKYGLLDPATH